ncbi:M23 family metallopeptidase [Sporolactobacillus shoreae]|uniref:M23 family metallopeptidase n=1 Tax=Sporolactobacillus shoreae TaxID=1465501 RepID=A0A4Z0GQU5_9BACL|nr:M23 family metallopeptidase [Sporolactobacillus shoreae]TGA99489.1 M23 family metallopeptidase [Sporolactobacillus shoreae]
MTAYEEFKKRHNDRKDRRLRMIGGPDGRNKISDYPDYYRRYSPADDPGHGRTDPGRPGRRFLAQCLIAGALFGSVYWVEANSSAVFLPVKNAIAASMTDEFQFAAVSSWYEKNFGNPISFLPGAVNQNTGKSATTNGASATPNPNFAEPVIGEVTAPYSSKTKGVVVKTTSYSSVKAVKDGLVVFVGKKTDTGETVIIQHKGSDESWYGKLDKANVKVYDEVKQGQIIGTTSGGKQGTFYFALKKGAKFIDPIQVMSFD